jgi:hypothetical protein
MHHTRSNHPNRTVRTRAHNPCPAFIPSTEDVAKQLAEANANNAELTKQVAELTKQLANVKVKAEPSIVGLYGNTDGTIVREVYEGTGKGVEKSYFTKNPGGTKKYLKDSDADNWIAMDEETVKERVAAHNAKMAALKGSSPAK